MAGQWQGNSAPRMSRRGTRVVGIALVIGMSVLGLSVAQGASISKPNLTASATAEEWKPPVPDITLASPSEVGLPAAIVLSSPYPDVEVWFCSGVGTGENCYPYLVGRSGPDASGRYLSEWQLPMAPTGAIELGVSADSFGTFGTLVTFTVTGNRFNYTDFRSCTREELPPSSSRDAEWYRNHPKWVEPSQTIVDYYAQVDTSLTYQLQRKVRTKTNRTQWATIKKYSKRWDFPIAHSELAKGYGPYERREAKQNIPEELLFPAKQPASKYRVVYFVRQGQKLLKRGVVSKKPCQKIDDPPYYIP